MRDKDTAEFQDMLSALRMLGGNTVSGASGGRAPARLHATGIGDLHSRAALNRLERENTLLIDHAEMLACALGACPNCWGTIDDCEDCGGIGRPGAFNPDRACFDHFVLPVIIRVLGHSSIDTSGA
ncbi:hypothetical protein [Paracoccus sp. Ld10]|uniref:hypothetical protein n=1 Tax=Paracoccus sp. Ld10 TaxID=649158 RepID=UPI0038632208